MKDSLDILLTEPVYVAHDSLDILNPDVICHHGILGMKWGIRRYQNKDGSLTAAGKKRYYFSENNYEQGWRWGGGNLSKKGEKAFKNRKGEWKNTPAAQKAKEHEERNKQLKEEHDKAYKKKQETMGKKGAEYRKTVDFLSEDKRVEGYRNKDPKIVKRMNEAADLGLRAHEISRWGENHSKRNDKEIINALANNPIEKTTVIDSMGYSDENINRLTPSQLVKNARDWFIWEDQTIGQTQTADLINQGYPKEKVKEMRDVLQIVPPGRDDIDNIGFEMQHVDDDFIDACYLIKDAQKNKRIY